MNMKNIFTYVSLCLFSVAFGQAPSDYYSGTENLTKEKLKTKLSSIITNGHKDRGYNGLWTAYKSSDVDKYFENDGTLLDMYSENPSGADPYNYKLGTNQCGNYTGEGNCYNREHSIPQSTFGKKDPMVSDAHHIVPTDGFVNGKRSSFPYGEVKSATYTSKNGSKLGSSSVSGYGGTVFEPIDEFKGDFARIMFYFVTRYESQIPGFNYEMFSNSEYPGLSSWSIPMLLKWHREDPVNQREIDRNNALFSFQGNRNPFIDNPNYVELIWGDGIIVEPTPDTEAPTVPTNITAGEITSTTVKLNWNASKDDKGVVSYKIYNNGTVLNTISASGNTSTTFSTVITRLTPETAYSLQISAVDAAKNESEKSELISFTTLKEQIGVPGGTGNIEDFENIPEKISSYTTVQWNNNSIDWTANGARTDLSIQNGKAITIKEKLTSSEIQGGISSLTITTKLSFSGSAGNFVLKINGNPIAQKIPYGTMDQVITTTIDNINVFNDFTITLENEKTSNRVTIDDLSWTSYTLSTNEVVKNNGLKVYPNPIKNQQFMIDGLKNNETINVYSMTGQLMQTFNNVQNKQQLNLKKLPKGIYIVKTSTSSTKVIIE